MSGCSHESKSLKDLFGPGTPTLLTSGSSTGAVMLAKDACGKLGKEPVLLDVDLMDLDTFTAEVNSVPSETILIIGEARRAAPDVLEKVKEVVLDKTRTVIVADSKPPPGLDPKFFTDNQGHHARF